jgi:hypothetical protein
VLKGLEKVLRRFQQAYTGGRDEMFSGKVTGGGEK